MDHTAHANLSLHEKQGEVVDSADMRKLVESEQVVNQITHVSQRIPKDDIVEDSIDKRRGNRKRKRVKYLGYDLD
jgi:hypothetical protein